MKKHTGSWRGLMVHHTATAQSMTPDELRRLHLQKGWGDVGYHYIIAVKNGRGYLKAGRSDLYDGAHCDAGGFNSTYLGVAVVGNYSETKVPGPLYSDILGALAHLCRKYGISELKGHCEAKATQCPGKLFPLEQLKRDLKIVLAEKEAK